MSSVKVEVNGVVVGELVREKDELIFTYERQRAEDFVSLSMQVRRKPFVHKRLHPIFEMHLPEGYLLSVVKKHFAKLTRLDDFGLLSIMTPSIKGRLSYQTKQNSKTSPLALDDLLYPQNENLFEELVHRFALSSALSGVQPKVLVSTTNKATLKIDDYIVKSWGEDYKELALNEYYCMRVVKNANIKVSEFFVSSDERLFIMKRFDRTSENYIGFEDMCVLQGKQRDDKYESSCEQVVKTIKSLVSSAHKKASLLDFFKMMFINYRVQNGDAHLKNFGLIYSSVDDIQLAPAYDVVSTTAYIASDIPALLMLGSKKWWSPKYLARFGIEVCELTQKEVTHAIEECEQSLLGVREEISVRMQTERNEDKLEILGKLWETFGRGSLE